MRVKYIEERFPYYFELPTEGTSTHAKMVSSPKADFGLIPRDLFEKLEADRDATIDMLIAVSMALSEENPELFNHIWYGV